MARKAAIPWRTWAMPASPWSCMASAHPRKLVPTAAQSGKPCSVESATAASACSCTAGTSRRNCRRRPPNTAHTPDYRDATAACANARAIVEAGQGLLRIPQHPEGPGGIDSAANTRIGAHAERRSTALVWRVACDGFLQVQASRRQRTKEEPRRPKGIVGDDRERGVWARCARRSKVSPSSRAVCNCSRANKTDTAHTGPGPAVASRPPADTTRVPGCRRAPPRALPCPLVISSAAPRAMYRVKACWVCSGVSGRDLSSSMPGGEVADGFQMGRAVAGLLARSLPVGHRLLGAARRGVVLGHQLRLRLD